MIDMRMRRVTALALATSLVAALAVATGSAPAAAATPPTTLRAGSALQVGTGHHVLQSASGAFSLELFDFGLLLSQKAEYADGLSFTGGGTWSIQRSNETAEILDLQTNGNLVLYDTHHHAYWNT